jgi:hypothetical protein
VKYYDRDGKLITPAEFQALWLNHDYRRVGHDTFSGISISTVWLGSSHGPGPLIFETMVFGDPERQDDQWRYATLREAQAGHTAAVARYSAIDRLAALVDLDAPPPDLTA